MGLIKSDAPQVLNFIVTGQVRCGASAIQQSVNRHTRAVCHSDVMHPDDTTRRIAHEKYFGPSGTTPDWLVDGHISGEQYLTNKIFDNALKEESAVGVKVLYPHIYRYDLWEYFANRCRCGDFCVIQLKRNPIASFLSLREVRRQEGWESPVDPVEAEGLPSQININDLVQFVRAHAAAEQKVASMCEDRLEIEFSELFLNFRYVMEEVMDFLNLPFQRSILSAWAPPKRSLERRVVNWRHLKDRVPVDVARYFEDEKLY
jgi:hypothetical protein